MLVITMMMIIMNLLQHLLILLHFLYQLRLQLLLQHKAASLDVAYACYVLWNPVRLHNFATLIQLHFLSQYYICITLEARHRW